MKTTEKHLQRMEALVRRMSERSGIHPGTVLLTQLMNEARAIVVEIDGPKTDEEWAIKMAKSKIDIPSSFKPDLLKHWSVKLAQEAIAKGRELERNSVGNDKVLTIRITGPQGSGKTRWADYIRRSAIPGAQTPLVIDDEH